MDSFEQLDLRDLISPIEIASHISTALTRSRLVHVKTRLPFGNGYELWDILLNQCGKRIAVDEDVNTGQPINNLWSSVEYNPAIQNRFRHSCSAQPLHTDGSYINNPPPIVFLLCERSAPSGGATLFLDGPELVDILSAEDPKLLEDLETTPIQFKKGYNEIIANILNHELTASVFRWNFYALDSHLPVKAQVLCNRFHQILQCFVTRQIPKQIRLEAGEAVFFHDDKLLHGREEFIAHEVSDRLLWKGGLSIYEDVRE